jgi:hypothetical protein
MLSDAFAKQDHTCFQGQRGDRSIQNLRTRKTICGYVPIASSISVRDCRRDRVVLYFMG